MIDENSHIQEQLRKAENKLQNDLNRDYWCQLEVNWFQASLGTDDVEPKNERNNLP